MPFQDRCVTISRNKLIAVTLGCSGVIVAAASLFFHGDWGHLTVPIIGLAAMFRIRALLGALVGCLEDRLERIEREAFLIGKELGRAEGVELTRLR